MIVAVISIRYVEDLVGQGGGGRGAVPPALLYCMMLDNKKCSIDI